MNKTKLQKGITLIALIITIVVLLVLAIVTIGAVQESEIIGHSQKAASDYKIAQEKELIGIGYSEYLIEKNTTQNAQLKVNGAQVSGSADAGWEVVFSETNSKYQVDKSGIITYIEEGEDGGQGDDNDGNIDPTEEIEWRYLDCGEDDYLIYIGSATELELTEDREVKAYPGTFNEDTEEEKYDESRTITVKLSQVDKIYSDTCLDKVTVGGFAVNASVETKELNILGDMTNIPEYYFDENSLEKVVIQDGVKTIGEFAFAKNYNLKSITLPASIENIYITLGASRLYYYNGTQEQWNAISSAFSIGAKVIFNDGTEIVV